MSKPTLAMTSIASLSLVITVVVMAGVSTYFLLSSPIAQTNSQRTNTLSSTSSTTMTTSSGLQSSTVSNSLTSQSWTFSAFGLTAFPTYADIFGNFYQTTWVYSSSDGGNRTFSFEVVAKPFINGSLFYVVNVSTANGFSGTYSFNSTGVALIAQTQFGNFSGSNADEYARIAMNPFIVLLSYGYAYDPLNPHGQFNFVKSSEAIESMGQIQMDVTTYEAIGLPVLQNGVNITSIASRITEVQGANLSIMAYFLFQAVQTETSFELVSAARA